MNQLFNILCFFIFFLPFQFALNVAPGFDVASIRVVILTLFAAVILKSLYKRDFFIPLNLQSICLAAFFLINIFSLFFAQNMEFGLRKILFLASIFPLYFVVSPLALDIVKYFIIGGFLASAIALIIFSGQFIIGIDGVLDFYAKIGPFFWGRSFSESVLNYQSFLVNAGGIDFIRAAGFFPDPHNFALFAGIVLFLSLPFIKSYFYGLTFLFSGATLILSFSRGAYMAAIGAIATVFILIKCHSSPVSQYRAGMIKWVAGVTILGIVFFLTPIKNRFLDTFSLEDGSNIGRVQIMKDGLNIFKNNFLFGVGIGNAPIYYNEGINYRNPTNSHNTYLEIAIESGIAGITVWSALIFGTILQLIKYLKSPKDEFSQRLAIGLIGALIFFSAHSFFEVFLYSPVNLAALMILLALSSRIIILSSKT